MAEYKPLFTFIHSKYPSKNQVYLHEPLFAGRELAYLKETLDSKVVSTVGSLVSKFEEDLAKAVDVQHTIALSSGTSALHLALKLAGVTPGDEVITQALTYVATVNPITYEGGVPVFVDVDRDTMGLSPVALRMFVEEFCEVPTPDSYRDIGRGEGLRNKRTGRRIAACMPMHTFGYPCRIEEISAICEEYNIPLIEDAAEAIGSSYNGRHLGTFGLLGAYSFNGNKTITSGGGGAIVTDREALATMARHLSTQAKVADSWESDHDHVGYNTRMPNLNAALALAQLEKLDDILTAKRNLANEYQELFKKQGLDFVQEIDGARANHWLNAIILSDKAERDAFLQSARDQNIECRPLWKLMSDLPMYKDCETDGLENSRYLQERVVALPSSVPRT